MLNKSIIAEFIHEASQTKRMLEKVPFDQPDWKPHSRSMKLVHLASHVAHIPKWISVILSSPEFDFTKENLKRDDAKDQGELMQFYQESYDKAIESLSAAGDECLMEKWTFRAGERIIFSLPRVAAIRTLALNHLIHHRGQLSVYLRLLDVPVPGMYGPSADEAIMMN
jgi:uncharacterized damage-inducible protein DinB